MSGDKRWFEGKRYGLFAHYLAAPAGNSMEEDIGVQEWNKRVNSFDTVKLAEQVNEAGADYLGITIGQNSGYYCSPNKTYDTLVGNTPGKCSTRDLVMELSQALAVYGIDLMVYLPSGAPDCDKNAVEKLEWQWGCEAQSGVFTDKMREERLAAFQLKWQKIITEWSIRWGKAVKAWWIDGCYFSEKMYLFDDEPNFHSFAAALRAGNPDAVLAFNTGLDTPFALESEESDYTAGEVGNLLPLAVCGRSRKEAIKEQLHGKKLHVLSYLGDTWGKGVPRMPSELAAGFTRYINERDGIVTWDIPLAYNGTVTESFMEYLKEIRAVLER